MPGLKREFLKQFFPMKMMIQKTSGWELGRGRLVIQSSLWHMAGDHLLFADTSWQKVSRGLKVGWNVLFEDWSLLEEARSEQDFLPM